jgi:hypothetical protein
MAYLWLVYANGVADIIVTTDIEAVADVASEIAWLWLHQWILHKMMETKHTTWERAVVQAGFVGNAKAKALHMANKLTVVVHFILRAVFVDAMKSEPLC